MQPRTRRRLATGDEAVHPCGLQFAPDPRQRGNALRSRILFVRQRILSPHDAHDLRPRRRAAVHSVAVGAAKLANHARRVVHRRVVADRVVCVRQERAQRSAFVSGQLVVRRLVDALLGEASFDGMQRAHRAEPAASIGHIENVAAIARMALREMLAVLDVALRRRRHRGVLEQVGGERLRIVSLEAEVRHLRARVHARRVHQERLQRERAPLARHVAQREATEHERRVGLLAGRDVACDATELEEALRAARGSTFSERHGFDRLAQ